jgi:penicillin-binding protein 1A
MFSRLVCAVALTLGLGACAYDVEVAAPPPPAESTKVFAADGTLITTLHAEQDREPVALEDMAPTLRAAVLAIEDSRFYRHKGIDVRALLRALRANAASGEVKEGGSTITQQYIKNVLLDPEQTVDRKVREAVLAFHLERRLTKNTILERYLNRIYFGNGAYGVQAASILYFGKGASELNLAESALLAGIIQAPERHDPFSAPEDALARRNVVLDRMEDLGSASRAEVEAARAMPLGVGAEPAAERYPAPYFVERVKQFILDDERFGETPAERRRLLFEGGLRIDTTVDLVAQQSAEDAVAAVLTDPVNQPAAASAVIDPKNGFVRALVGGRDFFGADPQAKFDLATQGKRQSGSSFKPLVLAAAHLNGISPDRVFESPGSLSVPLSDGQPDWVVENYEGSGGPPVTLAEATVKSVNTVYAQLIMEIGPEKAVETARKMGIRSELKPYPSAVLGTNEVTVLDMASAYATLAADGMHSEPVFVTEVARADGSVLYRRPATRQRVLPAETARMVNTTLTGVIEHGTGVKAQIGRPAAGKTGTAQQWRDAWFVGYTPDLAGAVWVGFPDRQRSMVPPATPMNVTGGSWPAEIWQKTMSGALAAVPPTPFPTPTPVLAAAPTPSPERIPVPDLGGIPEADAHAQLTAAGFVVSVEHRPSDFVAAGLVARQIPTAWSLVSPGAPLTLVISTGAPKPVTVPDLVGLTVEEAAKAAEAAGLVAEVLVEPPPDGVSARPGRVWKQSTPAGKTVDEGSSVRLWARP